MQHRRDVNYMPISAFRSAASGMSVRSKMLDLRVGVDVALEGFFIATAAAMAELSECDTLTSTLVMSRRFAARAASPYNY